MEAVRLRRCAAKGSRCLFRGGAFPPVGEVGLGAGEEFGDFAYLGGQVAEGVGHCFYGAYLRGGGEGAEFLEGEAAVVEGGLGHGAGGGVVSSGVMGAVVADGLGDGLVGGLVESVLTRRAAAAVASSAAE